MKENSRIEASTNTDYQFSYVLQVEGVKEDFIFIPEGASALTSFNASTIVIASKIALPKSKGELELNNTDPRKKNPIVEFNYLENEVDLEEEGAETVQLLEKIAMSMSITRFTSTRPQHNSSSSGELRNYCKQNVGTHYHYHGGCTVGSVVDKDYKVPWIKGLRVIDGASFWPGTLLMLERYQGIKILEGREIASPFAAQPCP